MTRICDRLLEPQNLIALLILGQLTFWTAAPVISHISPPRDVVEIYLWGREWVIATHKHPGLATWVLEATHAITGSYGWPSYAVSEIFIAVTYVCVFVLGRHLMGAERAAAGTLLLTGVAYNAWWTTEFKHNIAEAPFWVGLPWLVWRAVEQRSSYRWLLAGAFAGVGMYARLSVGLVLVVLGVWILVDARARHSLLKPGPWLALVLFIAICAPLGWWLVAQDYTLLAYAYDRSLRSHDVGYFLLDTALNLVLVPIMLALAGLLGRKCQQGPETTTPEANVVSDYSRKLRFLLIVTGLPVTLVIIAAILTRGGLKTGWGNSIFNLIGLLSILWFSNRFTRQSLRRIALCAAVLLTVVPIGYVLVLEIIPRFNGMTTRVLWPQAEISRRMTEIWSKETGQPLRIVSGNAWIAGLVGLTAKDRPSLLNQGELKFSPWITPARIDAEGMLVVWDARDRGPPKALQPWLRSRSVREETFEWPRSRGRAPLVIRYAIIPPKPGAL